MPDTTLQSSTPRRGPLLAKIYSRAFWFARVDAIATALLVGGGSGLVAYDYWKNKEWTVSHILSQESATFSAVVIPWGSIAAVLLGVLIAAVLYLIFAPDSVLTAHLVSARKQFLDGEITAAECERLRKASLRKGRLY